VTLSEENSSGLSGSVAITYTGDDSDIVLTVSYVTYTRDNWPDLDSAVIEDDEGDHVFTTAGCRVNQAVFSFEKNQPLTCELGFFGKSQSKGAAGSATTGLTPDSSNKLLFHHGVLEINDITYKVSGGSLSIDNGLYEDHENSQTADELPAMFQEVNFNFSLPAGTDTDEAKVLVDDFHSGTDRAGKLTFTRSSKVLEFYMPSLKLIEDSRDKSDKKASVKAGFTCEARRTDSAEALRIRESF